YWKSFQAPAPRIPRGWHQVAEERWPSTEASASAEDPHPSAPHHRRPATYVPGFGPWHSSDPASYPSKSVSWPISTSSASKPSHRNNGHEQKLRLQTSKNLVNEQQESSRPNRRDFFLFKGDRASTCSLSAWTDRGF